MSGFDFDFITTLKLDNGDFDVLIQAKNFRPARPAPACNNPDSPAFSDCGDDAEVEEYTVHFYFQKEQVFFVEVPEKLLDILDEIITDKIFTKGEEIYMEEIMNNKGEEYE